ncbi:MAG: ComEC/Rec2 family competence protein [Patescibacteria group bacterium]
MEKIKQYGKIIFLASCAVLAALVWYAALYAEAHRNLNVSFFDVGQGDTIFIESPDRTQILIDGGPGNAILAKLGRAMPFWDRSLDLVILTHAHADHVSGLVEVLKRYRVDRILESGEAYGTPEYAEWRRLAQEKNIPVTVAHAGQEIRAGALVIAVLSPFENKSGVSLKNPHDANVSTKLIYGGTSALLMGDAEKMIEYRLVYERSESLRSDVLKVGHHGSKTSSSQEFLAAVSPKIAIIQAGRKNRYGHPTQEVLDRISAAGAAIFRTDLDGDIALASNGIQYWIER